MVGYIIDSNFTVDSELNLENLETFKELVKKFYKGALSKKKYSSLKKARKLLLTMVPGGSTHPEVEALNQVLIDDLIKSVKLVQKTKKAFLANKIKKRKVKRAAKKIIKNLEL